MMQILAKETLQLSDELLKKSVKLLDICRISKADLHDPQYLVKTYC